MRGPTEKASFLFRAAAALAAVFCITIFALVAAMMSDGRAPLFRLLNDHGGTIILIEVVATLSVAFLAMAADRIKTLRALREQEQNNPLPDSDDDRSV